MSRRPNTSWGGYINRTVKVNLDALLKMAEAGKLVRVYQPTVVGGSTHFLVVYVCKDNQHRRYNGRVDRTRENLTKINVIRDMVELARQNAQAAAQASPSNPVGINTLKAL